MRGWKRTVDFVGAALLLLVFAPIILMLVAAVRLTSPGPAFHRQVRYGLNGRRFEIIKFRTMFVDAEHHERASSEIQAAMTNGTKMPDDPRVTTLGRDMRMLSLDELPQLWNVLRGDMSLVGPRPLRHQFELDWYRPDVDKLLSARPGMTGLWQVSGRNDLDVDTRVALDLQYVDEMRLSLDLRILFRTIGVVLLPRGNGAY